MAQFIELETEYGTACVEASNIAIVAERNERAAIFLKESADRISRAAVSTTESFNDVVSKLQGSYIEVTPFDPPNYTDGYERMAVDVNNIAMYESFTIKGDKVVTMYFKKAAHPNMTLYVCESTDEITTKINSSPAP